MVFLGLIGFSYIDPLVPSGRFRVMIFIRLVWGSCNGNCESSRRGYGNDGLGGGVGLRRLSGEE